MVNMRLDMLYSVEDEYNRLSAEIDNYYFGAMKSAESDAKLQVVKADYLKHQEAMKKYDKMKKDSVGIDSKLITLSAINNKLSLILQALVQLRLKKSLKLYSVLICLRTYFLLT